MAQLTQRLPAAIPELDADLPVAVRALDPGRLALPGLAALSAGLYLVNLTISGWANTYYALAAQAASQSWTALFFGSLDASNFVTLDKPPLAILPMAISVKLLGLDSFALLLPEALFGVGTVVVLYLAVRRSFGPEAGFLAGLIAAVTPVAVLIFRYDNPDALLTFLLVSAAWALGRGLESGRARWAILAATFVGLGFLTKYLQAYLVLPGFALAWFVAAPGSPRKRVATLVASLAAVLVSSGWWVAIVELIPAASRPYIGGSTNNSVLDLIFGYDGLGRIFGQGAGGGGIGAGPSGTAAFSGEPGLLRLFNDQLGGQVAWLLPAALLGLAAGVAGLGSLVMRRRISRQDRRLAGYLLWGGWLLTHVLVFSFMSGIIHSYYAVALVPAIAALVGAGARELWVRRDRSVVARLTLAAGIAATGLLASLLLDRTPAFVPGLGIGILAIAGGTALVLALPPVELDRRLIRAAAAVALAAVLAGPVAYSAATIAQAHSGGDAAAGPVGDGNAGQEPVATNTALVRYLLANQGSARWIVAVQGSQNAADIQLAAGQPVMSMGGFNGSDATPTLAQLQSDVATGELRFVYLGGGGPGGLGGAGFGRFGGGPGGFSRGPGFGGPGGSTNDAIASWVASSCTAVRISGSTARGLYDCAGA